MLQNFQRNINPESPITLVSPKEKKSGFEVTNNLYSNLDPAIYALRDLKPVLPCSKILCLHLKDKDSHIFLS